VKDVLVFVFSSSPSSQCRCLSLSPEDCVPYCTVLRYTLPCCTVVHCSELCCAFICCAAVHCAVMYCAVTNLRSFSLLSKNQSPWKIFRLKWKSGSKIAFTSNSNITSRSTTSRYQPPHSLIPLRSLTMQSVSS
jgi:hypothetical protein